MKSLNFGMMIALAGLAAASAGPSLAASVKNSDAETVVLKIVENGKGSEIMLRSGQEEQICPEGCFLSLPNGDRIGLSGGENVEIIKGGAVLK